MHPSLPSQINDQVINQERIPIFILEPHPDDALGSASGLIFSDISGDSMPHQSGEKNWRGKSTNEEKKISYRKEVEVTVFTISKPNESDYLCDCYDLTAYKAPGGITERGWTLKVNRHILCDLPDYHYNKRNQDPAISYQDKVKEYLVCYPVYQQLEKKVEEIFLQAKKEKAYVAIPAGFEHPLHILVAYASCEVVNRLHFDPNYLVIYVDHPYDFQLMGTGRTKEVKSYLQKRLARSLIRCSDTDAQQRTAGKAVREIYGEMHFGEFDGSLERTGCSYFLTEQAYHALRWDLKLWRIRVLYATSQALPYYKKGGLADVSRTYCEAMLDCVDEMRILMPRYADGDRVEQFQDQKGKTVFFRQKVGGAVFAFEIETRVCDPLIYYLVSIRDAEGKELSFVDEKENGKSYAIFSDGMLAKGLSLLDYPAEILHCNDWQMGLFPFLMKTKYKVQYAKTRSVYTIHFGGYRGVFPKEMILPLLENRPNWKCTPSIISKIESLKQKDYRKLVDGPQYFMSFFRAGCEFADQVTTVSKGYAAELERYPEFSRIPVTGIRNGIVRRADPQLEMAETEKAFQIYKQEAKRRLQQELGLEQDLDVPLISVVSRLSIEKGMDMLRNIVPYLMEEGLSQEYPGGRTTQMVVVGDDGDPLLRPYSSLFGMFQKNYPGRFVYRPFSSELEFRVYAASDLLLMPSLSEACGTTQMQAMAYGVVPVVSSVSGFRDTVLGYQKLEERAKKYWEMGVGFYSYPDCWTFLEVLKKAISVYCETPDVWAKMREYNRKTDFRWKNGSLAEYLDLYHRTICRRRK